LAGRRRLLKYLTKENVMAAPELSSVRRIVTEEGSDGRSRIVSDGSSPSTRTVPERPGYRITNLWRTSASPSIINEPDMIVKHSELAPPDGGTLLRIVDYPPEANDATTRRLQQAATFGQLFTEADHRLEGSKHPGMHRTETIDYAIVLEGEIVAILDEEETVMRQGDIMVQRGTAHAWANRSDRPARIAFVLIDAKR
jgi:hypothetical protein